MGLSLYFATFVEQGMELNLFGNAKEVDFLLLCR